jgi:hypothetical protein
MRLNRETAHEFCEIPWFPNATNSPLRVFASLLSESGPTELPNK